MPDTSGPKPPLGPPPDDEATRGGGALASLGFQFAAAIVLCVLGGNWIDGRFGTGPWGVLIGAAVGFAAGFYSMLRAVSRQTPSVRPPGPDGKGRDTR